jgi:hemoglobin/transferrin/lactoferrin receptor protein
MVRFGLRATLMASGSGLMLTAAMHAATAQEVPAPVSRITLDEITITASKDGERAIDALASVSVTNRTEIRSQQPQRIGSMVNQIPGVAVQENPNDPATAINIRGLQDFGRVAVTVDGARQNFQRSGHNANGAFFLDSGFLRSIDVTRGPVANVYGSGAIGGVVSFETVDPRDILLPGERFAVEGTATGVFGRQTGFYTTAIMALRAHEMLETLVGLNFKNIGEYKDGGGNLIADSGQELKSGIGKIVITPGEGHQIKLGGLYQNYDFTSGPGTATSPRRFNDVTTTNFTARYTFSRPDVPWLNLTANAYITTTDTDQRRVSGTAAQQTQTRFFKIETSGFDVFNTSKFVIGGGSFNLTYGVDYFRDKVSTLDVASNGDETTPSGERGVYGGFVQGHLKYGMFDVIGALRYDGYTLNGNGTSSEGQRLSPKITFGFTPVAGLQFYGTYAEGYRAPAITETLVSGLHPIPASFLFIPNPNLKPEVGKTLEAGINIKYDNVFLPGDRLRGKFAVFRNNVTNFIDGVFVDPGAPCGAPIPGACADAFYTYQNVASARLTGVEGEAVYDARRWFVGFAGSMVRGDNLTLGVPLQSIYPDKFAISGGVRLFDEKLQVGGRVTFVAAQTRLPAVALLTASDAYTLVDLNATYNFTADTRAYVSVENIGDVRYKRYRDGDFSPGLVAKIGFTTRFGG